MVAFLVALTSNLLVWLWLIAAFYVGWITRDNPRLKVIGFVLLVCIWLLSTRPVAEALIKPLESQYRQPDLEWLQQQQIRQVVVLTGEGLPMKGELHSSVLGDRSIQRFLGGMEICDRLASDCRIIFTGSAGLQHPEWAVASSMHDLARQLIPDREAVAESDADTTVENARNVQSLVDEEPFLLITSAFHMARSMKMFQQVGLDPVPYPVDFLVAGHYVWADILPSSASLHISSLAFREYLAVTLHIMWQ